MTKLQTPTRSYVTHYPEAIKFAETQETIFWTANEINVDKDKQDMLVNMTEAENHSVVTTLKLFTLYEMRSEEHTSELQSLMRISYSVFCLIKKIITI